MPLPEPKVSRPLGDLHLLYREEVKDLSLGFRNREAIVFINFLLGAGSDVREIASPSLANSLLFNYVRVCMKHESASDKRSVADSIS